MFKPIELGCKIADVHHRYDRIHGALFGASSFRLLVHVLRGRQNSVYREFAAELKALEEELQRRQSEDRPAIIAAIAEARAHGDLSENAEYHAAKEQQSLNEGRVSELEDMLSRAEIIDVSKLGGDSVKFGATVELADEDTDEESTYQIVGEDEADIASGLISFTSPIARALIGKDEGDSVEVRTPGGEKSYEILKIVYR